MNRNIRVSFLKHPFVSENKTLNRNSIIIFYVVFVLTILLFTQFDSLFLRERYYGYKEGDRVEETVLLTKSLSFIDEKATEKKQNLAMELILPVYVIKENINERILEQYSQFRNSLSESNSEGFPQEKIESLDKVYPGFQYLGDLREVDPVRLNLMMSSIQDSLETLLSRGILSQLDNSLSGATGLIEIFRTEIGEKTTMLTENALTIDNWQIFIRDSLAHYDFTDGETRFIELIVYYFLEANCFYSSELTELKQQEVRQTMTPVWIKLEPGDALLTKGSIVTSSEIQRIEAVKNSRGRIRVNTIITPFLYTALIFLFLAVLLIVFPSAMGLLEYPLLVFFLSLFHIVCSLLLYRLLGKPGAIPAVLFLPIGLCSFLMAILTNRRAALIFITVQSVFVFFVLGFHDQAFFMTLFTGYGACLVIEGAEKRIDLIKGGIYLALVQVLMLALMFMITPLSLKLMLLSFVVAILNGIISGFLSLMILPLFEHMLNACTTFRLQELSDLNAPLLKRMLALAPGTYAHSMNVANLAETGCRNIGADALLARVGGYYHDIGKIDQSKYFSENQKDYNKHDDLKTSLSVAVIKSHVKIGIEKARELGLPGKVISIIAQHHGTSVIEYFYQRAISEKGSNKVTLEDYSHSGPKPQSKEAAVVMLADMAEAATRSMSKPTVAKLEKSLWDLIMFRFKDGELNECGMTLQELESIKSSFVHVLTGQYHTRIEYPDREKE
ncbi:MAG: hypothetical protein B6241_09020 [Spirochaetaceae bacterium 4572_59]|nr:MAG: hypothetical protein B6241_09020 [Spirochaetaceae bacterium 4572_59]